MDGSQQPGSKSDPSGTDTISCVGLRITLEPKTGQVLWGLNAWDRLKRQPSVAQSTYDNEIWSAEPYSIRTVTLVEELRKQLIDNRGSLRVTLDGLKSTSDIDQKTVEAIHEVENELQKILTEQGAVRVQTAYHGWSPVDGSPSATGFIAGPHSGTETVYTMPVGYLVPMP